MTDTAHIVIYVNGEAVEVAQDCTVAGLVASRGLEPLQVAVELNKDIVPRAKHAETTLAKDDRIEIVTMVGGG